MALQRGTKIGPYEIVGLLGSGGMGEVYRARDSKLQRNVALKLLTPQFVADPERLKRFEREAQVLASLNHPHIGAIYGLEDSAPALVLELVEGETLSDRLRRKRLPVHEALRVAQAIAGAVEAAHKAGIIHRDLKPANIKITPDGVVKVLDFGIAKAFVAAESVEEMLDSPTATVDPAGRSAILGTAAYMSPEQARGEAVDKRTDIWAFGCVLYEMLTGTPQFARRTVTDTIAAVVHEEPNWSALPAETPESIRELLERCLRKDTKRRLHDIADARIEIEDTLNAPTATAATSRQRSWPRWAVWALPVVIAGLMLLAWMVRGRFGEKPIQAAAGRILRLTNLRGLEESPAISPDGKSMAFSAGVEGKRQIFVQLMGGGAPLQLTRDAVDHECPRWSPDSSSILYFSPSLSGAAQGSLMEVAALGGTPRRVVDSVGCADVSAANGRIALFRLAKDGIDLRSATRDAASFDVVAKFPPTTYYLYPRWSPDGKWIAFQRGDSIRFDIFVVPATGGEARQLTHDNNMISGFGWLPDSRSLVYSSSRDGSMPYLPTMSLWRVGLRDGDVRRVASGESSYVSPDIAKNGTAVVSRMKLETDIWKFPVDGSPADNVRRGVRLTKQTGQVLTPTASPDDKEVAFLSDGGGHANLWVVNTETGALRQITYERNPKEAVGVPVWSPTGPTITFVSSRGNQGLTFGVWLVDADGSNLRNIANPGQGPAWSPDGRWVYYSTWSGPTSKEVMLKKAPVSGGEAVTVRTERLRNVIGLHGDSLYYVVERPLVDGTPEIEVRVAAPEDGESRVLAKIPGARIPIWQICNPALSPDGKWLAAALTDGFTTNLWVLSTTSGEWRQITDFGDRPTFIARRVSWSSDGKSIYAAVSEGDSDIVLMEGLTGGAE